MKGLFVLFIGLLFISTSNATIRRVGFSEVPAVTGVDYNSFYDAYQAAVAGDTIYVFPGKTISGTGWPTAYARAEINKRLNIIGKGNLLDSSSNPRGNTGYQASKGKSYFGNSVNDGFYQTGIYFNGSAAGSILTGFDGQGQALIVNCNNLVIRRNFNINIGLINSNIFNLTIEQNYRISFFGSNDPTYVYSNFIIRNNFIYSLQLPVHFYSGVIANNTWAYDRSGALNGGDLALSYVNLYDAPNYYPQSYINLQGGSWLFENNLLIFYYTATPPQFPFVVTGTDMTTFNYNVASQSSNFTWPTGSNSTGNTIVPVANVSTIFENFPAIGNSSADGRYRLKAGSPALQASRPNSSADAGMFGGVNPYKLSTIPSIPTIYSISSPQGNSPVGNTIQIQVSTRSNN